jgi:O-antigen/teichoic acid export membrane protein
MKPTIASDGRASGPEVPAGGGDSLPSRLLFGRIRLPEGALALVAAVATSGLAAYAFLVLAARHLSPSAYAPLAAFWTLAFFVGPGIYVAVDQEMARVLSASLALGRATRPAATRVIQVGGGLTLLLVGLGFATAPILIGRGFDNQGLLFLGFLVILPAYCGLSAVVGMMNALGRLRGSATIMAGEALFRLAGCILLLLLSVRTAGPYGLAVGLAPFAATLLGVRTTRIKLTPGPPVPWRPVVSGLAVLIGGTVLNQFLLVIEPFIVKILAHSGQQAAAGRFLNAIALTRVPLFLFNAAIPVLLPRFTRLASAGRHDRLGHLLLRTITVVSMVFAGAIVVAGLFGPELVRLLFGPAYVLHGQVIALLAAGAGLYCIATVLSLALIASRAFGATVISWALGVASMLITTIFGGSLGLIGRAAWGYLLGCGVATLAMVVPVLIRQRKGVAAHASR